MIAFTIIRTMIVVALISIIVTIIPRTDDEWPHQLSEREGERDRERERARA